MLKKLIRYLYKKYCNEPEEEFSDEKYMYKFFKVKEWFDYEDLWHLCPNEGKYIKHTMKNKLFEQMDNYIYWFQKDNPLLNGMDVEARILIAIKKDDFLRNKSTMVSRETEIEKGNVENESPRHAKS